MTAGDPAHAANTQAWAANNTALYPPAPLPFGTGTIRNTVGVMQYFMVQAYDVFGNLQDYTSTSITGAACVYTVTGQDWYHSHFFFSCSGVCFTPTPSPHLFTHLFNLVVSLVCVLLVVHSQMNFIVVISSFSFFLFFFPSLCVCECVCLSFCLDAFRWTSQGTSTVTKNYLPVGTVANSRTAIAAGVGTDIESWGLTSNGTGKRKDAGDVNVGGEWLLVSQISCSYFLVVVVFEVLCRHVFLYLQRHACGYVEGIGVGRQQWHHWSG